MGARVDTFFLIKGEDNQYFLVFSERNSFDNCSQIAEDKAYELLQIKVDKILKKEKCDDYEILGTWQDWYEYENDNIISSIMVHKQKYIITILFNTEFKGFFELLEIQDVIKIREDQAGASNFEVTFLH